MGASPYFNGNGGDGICLGGTFYLASASLGHNTVIGKRGKAINYEVSSSLTHPNPVPSDISTNVLEGNAQNGI